MWKELSVGSQATKMERMFVPFAKSNHDIVPSSLDSVATLANNLGISSEHSSGQMDAQSDKEN